MPEAAVHVRLVAEAGVQRDLGERHVRRTERDKGSFHALATMRFAQTFARHLAIAPREPCRMKAQRCSDPPSGGWLITVDCTFDLIQPRRGIGCFGCNDAMEEIFRRALQLSLARVRPNPVREELARHASGRTAPPGSRSIEVAVDVDVRKPRGIEDQSNGFEAHRKHPIGMPASGGMVDRARPIEARRGTSEFLNASTSKMKAEVRPIVLMRADFRVGRVRHGHEPGAPAGANLTNPTVEQSTAHQHQGCHSLPVEANA